jgi:hypothetical protein
MLIYHTQGNLQKKLVGPFKEDFLLHKDGEIGDTEKTPCSKASARLQVTLSASLSATGTTQDGFVQAGSLDTGFTELLGLTWRKC